MKKIIQKIRLSKKTLLTSGVFLIEKLNYFTNQMYDKTLPIFETVNPQRTEMGPRYFTGVGGEIYSSFMMKRQFVEFASGLIFFVILEFTPQGRGQGKK